MHLRMQYLFNDVLLLTLPVRSIASVFSHNSCTVAIILANALFDKTKAPRMNTFFIFIAEQSTPWVSERMPPYCSVLRIPEINL
jgi:hypothetical protein